MKVLIVEDEPLSVDRLVTQLNQIDSSIEVIGITESIFQTVTWLQEHSPELIFLDIELADGQSFEIFKAVDVKIPVIFTTSYDEYALQAFRLNSIDYLLKPISRADLTRAIEKYKNFYKPEQPMDIEKLIKSFRKAEPEEFRQRFLVKSGQRYQSIETSDIAYFYLEDRVTFLVTKEKAKYTIDYTLEELESLLSPALFNRVTRSFIIHVRSIADIQVYFKGKLKLQLTPPTDKEVIISREYAAAFKQWLGK
jgi:two-component system response regulator LytT